MEYLQKLLKEDYPFLDIMICDGDSDKRFLDSIKVNIHNTNNNQNLLNTYYYPQGNCPAICYQRIVKDIENILHIH